MLKISFWSIKRSQKELSWSWMPLHSTRPWESTRDCSSAQAAKWNNWWVMGSALYFFCFCKIKERMPSLQAYFYYYNLLSHMLLSLVVLCKAVWGIKLQSNFLFFIFSSSFSQTPLKEQQGPEQGTTDILEQMGSKDVATELTNYDWELFTAMHEVRKCTPDYTPHVGS